MKSYIRIPQFTNYNSICNNNYSLSATQYKHFEIKNKNLKKVSDFLTRGLTRADLGFEVGSNCYIENSPYIFLKTKALQPESYIVSEGKESYEKIIPLKSSYMELKKGDIIISKDGNVGEAIMLEKDYPQCMLCSALYKLPITKHKYYLLAFIKSNLYRDQIDFLVPKGSTLRHGKKKILECLIPIPNYDSDSTMQYIEILTKAIIDKQIKIREKHNKIMQAIKTELELNQKDNKFDFSFPTISELNDLERMDSSLYSYKFKNKEFLIKNYKNGYSNIYDMGFEISRGQNLQISNIGKSVQIKTKQDNYYKLILPKFISKYGTINDNLYLGNSNKLKTLKVGDIIFGAEGNEKGRSIVVIEDQENVITNIHGITLNQNCSDLTKSIFVKLFLDYLRMNGMVDSYAVGSNGGSLAIKYWTIIPFPLFDINKEKEIAELYYSNSKYCSNNKNISDFLEYDSSFNEKAGIYDIDKSMKYLQSLLDKAIKNIADDIKFDLIF